MLIVWGWRDRKKRLGRVAEFCPKCDDARPFVVREHRQQFHVYFLPVNRGTHQGHFGTCQKCGHLESVGPADYAGYSRRRRATIEELVDETHPDLPEKIAAHLDARDRAIAGEAEPHERLAMIRQAFKAPASEVERRCEKAHFDRWSGLAFLGLLLAPVVVFIVLASMGWRDDEAAIGCLAAAGVMLGVLVFLLATDSGRYARRRAKRAIAPAIAPFAPSVEELQAVLDNLKGQGFTLGRKLDAQRLHHLIEDRYGRGTTVSSSRP